MKALLTKKTSYNGFGWSHSNLPEPVEVEVIGVPFPVDPGVIKIRMPDGVETITASFALQSDTIRFNRIDWEAMMTDEQKTNREESGIMFGDGSSEESRILPMDQVKFKQDN